MNLPVPAPYFRPKEIVRQTGVTPFTAKPTRHLCYHIWPVKANDRWKWNIQYLLQYIENFSGVRSIGVALDENSASFEAVQKEFGNTRIDNWITVPNSAYIREGTTFVDLLKTLPNGENDITWYGHAKGVRHLDHNTIPLIWASVMYRLTLEHLDEVDLQLQQYGITGCFKRHEEFRLPKHDLWHYSGSFYWFRNKVVFSHPEWHDLAPNFFGCIEAWPSRVFMDAEAGCLFADGPGNMYDRGSWDNLGNQLAAKGIVIDWGMQ